MPLEIEPYDSAEFLLDREDIVAYLNEALETRDAHIIAKSLRTVSRARGGMAQLAKDTGISEQALESGLLNADPDVLKKALAAYGIHESTSVAA